jgi:hypothetical protein
MTTGGGERATAAPVTHSHAAGYGFVVLAATIGAWLAWSLRVVNIEFDDGYATLVNSQYFLGISADYLWSRAPMMAWLLMPAEWLATALDLHPLDVRPHHAVMATIHFAYLIGVWRLLRDLFGTTWPVLIAYAAAIPTVVFFCYAPFISNDLLPGLVALAMLKLADSYAADRSVRVWLALVMLGAAVALVKHMYGAIWLAILVAHAALAACERPRDWRLLVQLGAAAACSGLIFWLAFALVLAGSFPDAPLLLRPLRQMNAVVSAFQQAGPISEIVYQWVYLRNLSIYGFLAMALVLPGIYLSWRHGDRLQRSTAIAWIVLFATMNLVAFKEARYLAYLSPLTALLLVPVVSRLLAWRRTYAFLIAAALIVDLGIGAREAMRIGAPFYRDQVQTFLADLPRADALSAPIVMTRYLSFVSPDRYAFFGDRYHRIVHLNDDQIRLLYGYPRGMLRRVPQVRALSAGMFAPGSILIFVNGSAARVPPIDRDNRTTLQPDFAQLLAVAEPLTLRRDGGDYRLDAVSAQPIMLLRADHVDAEPLTSFERFPAERTRALLGLDTTPERLPVLGMRIHAFCDIGGCREF